MRKEERMRRMRELNSEIMVEDGKKKEEGGRRRKEERSFGFQLGDL